MLNPHPLECTIKDNDHIPDLLLIKYWEIISCKYIHCRQLSYINIPENVTTIKSLAFDLIDLDEIHVESETPITLENSSFVPEIQENTWLYVPTGSKEAYQNAPEWKEFHHIIEE